MAAGALLRSVASKMSRAAAPTRHHPYPCLVARGLHGGARSGPAACLAPPPHRLLHGRGLHSRTSPDVSASTPPKVLHTHTTALAKARAGVAYIALFGTAIYLHFWAKPAQEEAIATFETVYKQRSDLIKSHQANIHAQREMLVKLQTPSTPDSGHVNATDQGTGIIDKLGKEASKTVHSQENHIKELEATVVDLKAEIAELKIALDSAASPGKA